VARAPFTFRHVENCLCYDCRRRARKATRLAARRPPVRSDETATRIAALRRQRFKLQEIADAAELSVGVVHKASRPGAFLRPETAERLLELVVKR
jgi:hypothetical protein